VRHSTAHLLAQATQRLFPGAQVTIGPVVDNGFYYDFAFERAFTPEDLAAIEAEMAKIVAEALPVQRSVMAATKRSPSSRPRASCTRPRSSTTSSRPGRRPRSIRRASSPTCAAARTCRTRASSSSFKLMKVAGAYWRGDSKNESCSASTAPPG
jgi:threonyl-tRNA synthetase